MINIPSQQTRSWQQTNAGEVSGNLFATNNMNFDQRGYAKLARRSLALAYGVTSFGRVNSIQTIDGVTYYVMTSSHPFSVTLGVGGTTDLNGSGRTGDIKFDGVIWQGLWYISQDTAFANFDGVSTWNTGLQSGDLTTGKFHPMCVHEGLNYLAIGNGNTIKLFSYTNATTHTLVTTVTIPANFQVRWIRYNNGNLYIGTLNTTGGESFLFVSDGTSTSAQASYRIPGTSWAFSGVVWRGVLCLITSLGQLLKFNGSGFDELAHLPVYDTSYAWFDGTAAIASTDGKVSQRGMCVQGDNILINLDGVIASPSDIHLPNQPSGLWVYDPNVGLYHKAGLSADTPGSYAFSGVNTSTDTITIASYTAQTGTKVFVSASTVTGLTASKFYYLIRVGSTTFKLATSYNNAIAGTAVDLTAGSTGTVLIHNDFNFGETLNNSYAPGAVAVISDLQTSVATNREYIASEVLFGAGQVLSEANATKNTLQTLTQGYNRGSFTTTKIFSANVRETWQRLYTKYSHLFEGNDTIDVKYRTSDKRGLPLTTQSTKTWLDAYSYRTTDDLSNVSVGDEAHITSGRGAGCRANIVAKQQGATEIIITLDEAIPGVSAGDTSWGIIYENWKKLNSNTMDGFLETSLGGKKLGAKWCQFKIGLRGVSEPYIEELQIAHTVDNPVV